MIHKLIIVEKSHIALIYSGEKLTGLIMEHKVYSINDIYLGKVSSLLPSVDAAFIVLNPAEKNGFAHLKNSKILKKEINNCKSNKTININSAILTQITREPVGTKGPSVTCDLTLTGKYVAFFPLSKSINITKKHTDEKDREYLRALGYLLIDPKQTGILIKPEAISANVDFLLKEISILKHKWIKILKNSKEMNPPSLISKRKRFINKIFEQYSGVYFDHISIDSYEGALKIKKILLKSYTYNKYKNIQIEFHKNSSDLIKHHLIDILVSEIMKPRVNLRKGGYIVIEKTEALTTIDVNSGSFKYLGNSRDTSLWINYVAAHEISKQIKLRNLGGIIIIDFIDCTTQEDQMKILRYMSKLIKKDWVQCNIIQMSELGLVEITRARQGQSVYDAFSRKCNVCNGLGYLALNLYKKPSVNYELLLDLLPSFHNRFLKKNLHL
jgi:ribonuclease E